MAMAWYPHFMSDYESDTTHLSLMEHGAYRLLLDHYYKKRQPLPANASILHRVCRAFADDEQAAVHRVLEEFFVLKGDGYHQKRADKEIKKADEISGKRSAAAQVRYKKDNELQLEQPNGNGVKPPDANALQMQSKSTAKAPANAVQMDTQLTTHNSKNRDMLSEAGKSDPVFEALASVCRIDWRVCTAEQRGALNQTAGILRKAGHTAAEISVVGEWWFRSDWRGKQGQAPRPDQVREVWQQAFNPAPDLREHPNAYRPGKMVT